MTENQVIKDYLPFGTLLISLFSLFLSIINVYWNVLRGVKFTSPPIRWIMFFNLPVEQGNYTIINLPVFVTNTGGRIGVIDSFYIDLMKTSPTEEIQRFYARQEGNINEVATQGFKIDIPSPVSLKPGETLVKYYSFVPSSLDYQLTLGNYRLRLYAFTGENTQQILSEQKLEVLEVFQSSILQGIAFYLFSFNLLPKKVIKVMDYQKAINSKQMDIG